MYRWESTLRNLFANFNIIEGDFSHSLHWWQTTSCDWDRTGRLSKLGKLLLLNIPFQIFDLIKQFLLVFLLKFQFLLYVFQLLGRATLGCSWSIQWGPSEVHPIFWSPWASVPTYWVHGRWSFESTIIGLRFQISVLPFKFSNSFPKSCRITHI